MSGCPLCPLPATLVVNDATGAQHRGVLQLPHLAPPPPVPPSAAVLARLDPLLRAHGEALTSRGPRPRTAEDDAVHADEEGRGERGRGRGGHTAGSAQQSQTRLRRTPPRRAFLLGLDTHAAQPFSLRPAWRGAPALRARGAGLFSLPAGNSWPRATPGIATLFFAAQDAAGGPPKLPSSLLLRQLGALTELGLHF